MVVTNAQIVGPSTDDVEFGTKNESFTKFCSSD